MTPGHVRHRRLKETLFQNNLDYIDDNADKLARKKMRADHMKRQFAINGKLICSSQSSHLIAGQIIRRP